MNSHHPLLLTTIHTALFSVLLTTIAFGGDWTQFRGPGGTGIADLKNVPTNLSEDRCAWKIDLNGTGHASPVIYGKKLFYTLLPSNAAETRVIVCVSTDEGKELWRKSFPFAKYEKHQFNSFTSSTPVVDAERVYVWWADATGAEALALDHDGTVVWQRKLGTFESQHGSGSSLVLSNGILVVQKENLAEESFIFGLDAASGETVWKHPMPTGTKTPYVTPLLRESKEGPEAIFVSTDNGIVCLNTKTGAQRWKFDPKFEHRVVASPVICDDILFASCGGGGGGKASVTLHIPKDTTEPKELYRLDKQLPYVPTGIGTKGLFFLVSDGGIGTCIDAKTGEQIWRQRLVGQCFASQVCIDDNVYVFGRDGDYKVYKASKTFEVVGEGEMTAPVHATPSIGDNRLFIRTDTQLICFVAGEQA